MGTSRCERLIRACAGAAAGGKVCGSRRLYTEKLARTSSPELSAAGRLASAQSCGRRNHGLPEGTRYSQLAIAYSLPAERRHIHTRNLRVASRRRNRHATALRPEKRLGRNRVTLVRASDGQAKRLARRNDCHERTGARIRRTAHFRTTRRVGSAEQASRTVQPRRQPEVR